MDSFPVRFGRYELIDLLATGGMAEVFRARLPGKESSLNKIIAVKRILPTYSKNENFVRLFEKEIGLALGLNHPNLVKLYESGVAKNQYFMAMEYVHGKTLDVLVDRCTKEGVKVPPDFACYMMREVCKVLTYAHTLKDKVSGKFVGIIHRDISPQNVIFSYEGHVKLFDFGVAKVMSRDSSTIGGFSGKPAYMSPEQARGEELDSRTDLFSLGVVLWELLTGKRLFFSEQPLLAIRNITEMEIMPPSSVNPKVPKVMDAIVMKALARPLSSRYQSAQEFQSDLEMALKTLAANGYGETQAGKFITSVMGAQIESDNAELYRAMKAQAPVKESTGEVNLFSESSSPLAMQPEWVRTNAARAMNAEKTPADGTPAPQRNSGLIRKPPPALSDALPEPPKSSGLTWIGVALALVLIGGALYAYHTLSPAAVEQMALRASGQEPALPEVAKAPAPAALAVPAVAREPANIASPKLETPAQPTCDEHSSAVCALSNGAPITYANSCAADTAKAVLLYTGKCDEARNPDLHFNAVRLQDTEWHTSAESPHAAVFEEVLDVSLVPTNVPPELRLHVDLISADGKRVIQRDMPAPSTTLTLAKSLPRGTYDLEARILDAQGNALLTRKANQPFFLGNPSDMRAHTIALPASSKGSNTDGRQPANGNVNVNGTPPPY